jgi:hypothetical protein
MRVRKRWHDDNKFYLTKIVIFICYLYSVSINRFSIDRYVLSRVIQAILHRESDSMTSFFQRHASKNSSSQILQNLNEVIARKSFFRWIS